MNVMRRHITVGHGDGRAASNWIGSLRSRACGADGAYGKSGLGLQLLNHREDASRKQSTNRSFEQKQKADSKEETNLTVFAKKKRQDDLDSSLTEKTQSGDTKYQGNKTQAQMDGVPISMRWRKVNAFGDKTKGYLRLKEKLYRGSCREVASHWQLRGETPSLGSRLRTNSNLVETKQRKATDAGQHTATQQRNDSSERRNMEDG